MGGASRGLVLELFHSGRLRRLGALARTEVQGGQGQHFKVDEGEGSEAVAGMTGIISLD